MLYMRHQYATLYRTQHLHQPVHFPARFGSYLEEKSIEIIPNCGIFVFYGRDTWMCDHGSSDASIKLADSGWDCRTQQLFFFRSCGVRLRNYQKWKPSVEHVLRKWSYALPYGSAPDGADQDKQSRFFRYGDVPLSSMHVAASCSFFVSICSRSASMVWKAYSI